MPLAKNLTIVISVWVIVIFAFTLGVLFKGQRSRIAPSNPTPSSQVLPESTAKPQQSTLSSTEKKLVTKVIDGDTVDIEGDVRIRYIGIDTPELVDPRKTVECYAQQASAKNRELVEGKLVNLEKDVSEADRYGRLLRYVYTSDIFVNDYLVREGYARASSYPPDVKYQQQFQQAEQEARQNNRGLWSACQNGNTQQSILPLDSDCKIKGNISSSGEKIYHMSGQRYYEKTVIDEVKGERWFCTEEDAIVAGWRKSKI